MNRDHKNLSSSELANYIIKAFETITNEQRLLELTLRGEFSRRNFTKRQLNIVHFILSLSVTLGKDYAIVAQLQDFEEGGVSRTKIKSELTKLVNLEVIEWSMRDSSTHMFKIKDMDLWNVPLHAGFNDVRAKAIFYKNVLDKLTEG